MNYNKVVVLQGDEALALLRNRELEIMDAVKQAYQIHNQGATCVPHSSFIRFPDKERDRIIALPAFLGGDFGVAGVKWIASFPDNLKLGIERASAVLALNSIETGHIQAIMESSVISAKRTAASSALAGHTFCGSQPTHVVGIIGCGLINFETLRFLLALRPEVKQLYIYDIDRGRANQFGIKCQQLSETLNFRIVDNPGPIFHYAPFVILATTAITPHILDISAIHQNSVLVHTSLRDLSPEIILAADNVVDDVDHVCRAQTSIHLAEQQTGHRNFIRCTLGDIFNGKAPARVENDKVTIFSPFGLGILDLAVAQLVYKQAIAQDCGIILDKFLPTPWMDRTE